MAMGSGSEGRGSIFRFDTRRIVAAKLLTLLAQGFAAGRAFPAQPPVGPPPGLGLPALELDIVTARPATCLENHREAQRENKYAARARKCAQHRGDCDQDNADAEYRPLDNRMVDETPPLVTSDHCPVIWAVRTVTASGLVISPTAVR